MNGNDTVFKEKTTLFDYLEHYAEITPDKLALIDATANRFISYAQLKESVLQTSSALLSLGVGKGTKIVAIMEKSADLVELILASSAVEALILHLYPESYQVMLQRLHPRFVPDLAVFDKVDKHNELKTFNLKLPKVSPDTPLYVNYSSGSTGDPSLVVATHRQVIANTAAMASWFNMSSDDVHLCNFRSHAHEFFAFSLCTGGTSILLSDFNNPQILFEALVAYQATCLLANPATYIALQSYIKSYIKRRENLVEEPLRLRLRLALCGGASTSDLLRERVFQTLKTPLIEVWGSTETTGNVIANPLAKPPRSRAAGLPMPGYKVSTVREVREDGAIIPTNKEEIGEVVVQGESVASGYLIAPNAKENRLSSGIFRTGDLAYQDQDGFFYFQGRSDTKFKVGGKWVYPESVERVFKEDKRISDILIAEVPVNSLWGQTPAALVVLSKSKVSGVGRQGSVKEKDAFDDFRPPPYAFRSLLHRICKKAMHHVPDPFFSMPRYFLVVETLPKNAGGKVRRQEARTLLTSAVKRDECLRISLNFSWAFKSFIKLPGRWKLIKLLLSHPLYSMQLLREIL